MALIKENSPVALYHQLKTILAQKIMNNEWHRAIGCRPSLNCVKSTA